MKTYIVLHGLYTSQKSPVEYVEHIVYGAPRIEAVLVGSRLVAILEYNIPEHARGNSSAAQFTFERLGSFPLLGASLTLDLDVALREFGIWVRHYAPGTVAGLAEVAS